MNIAHIVSPVAARAPSDLVTAQPVTFESMRVARDFAATHGVTVSHYAVQARGEEPQPLPSGFARLPGLERTVSDLRPFTVPKKLPLLKDILGRLYEAAPQVDFLVYTNVDIALQPHFYLALDRLFQQGHDALVINRRTIPAAFSGPADLPLMWAQLGEPHIGHDCFVFRSAQYPDFRLGDVCIGTRRVGRVLLWNLFAHARSFRELKDAHLTFHIGAEKPWKKPEFSEYDEHNHRQALAVLRALEEKCGLLGRLQREAPEYLTAVDWQSLARRGGTAP